MLDVNFFLNNKRKSIALFRITVRFRTTLFNNRTLWTVDIISLIHFCLEKFPLVSTNKFDECLTEHLRKEKINMINYSFGISRTISNRYITE